MKLLGGAPDTGAKAAQQQLEMQRQQAETLRMQAEEERKQFAEQMAGKQAARSRGGNRMLLSEARLNPETGVEETLGGQA